MIQNSTFYCLLEYDTKQSDRQLAYVLGKHAATFSYSKPGGSTFLQCVGKLPQDYIVLHSTRW